MGRLAATGASDQRIADTMTLSRRTVSNTLSRLYRALDLDGRPALAELLAPVELWRPRPMADEIRPGLHPGTTFSGPDLSTKHV